MNLMTILVMKMICDQCLRTFRCPGRQISQFLQAHTETRTIQYSVHNMWYDNHTGAALNITLFLRCLMMATPVGAYFVHLNTAKHIVYHMLVGLTLFPKKVLSSFVQLQYNFCNGIWSFARVNSLKMQSRRENNQIKLKSTQFNF